MQTPLEIRKYWNFHKVLTVQDRIIYKGDQIVVPMAIRSSFLERLHASHLGYESTWRRAREVIYWPYRSEDIQRVRIGRKVCELDEPAQRKEKGISHEIPAQLWQRLEWIYFTAKEETTSSLWIICQISWRLQSYNKSTP